MLDRLSGFLQVEAHLAAEEIVWAQVAEHQVCISNRRLFAAAVVARRSRLGACAVWANFEEAQLIHPGEAATTGADLDHLDHRHLERQAATFFEAIDPGGLKVGGHQRRAVVDQADLGRCATHVERDNPLQLLPRAVKAGSQGASRRPRLDQADGVLTGNFTTGNSTVGEHDEEVAR